MDQDEPQKLIPTSNDKQTAGHSYSTRSKVKRTSHSDDAGSESELNQRPHKRQTRLSGRPPCNSAKTKNDDTTPDLTLIVTETIDAANPAEVALKNDLVLETLFRYMNRSDLLSCRVVNKQWQYEATKELRRRKLVIRFSFSGHEIRRSRIIAYREMCRRISKCRTPSLLSAFKVQTVVPIDLGSAGLGSIFTTVGIHLKNLTLHLNYRSKKCSFERSSLMTHLQSLLCRQAPNLEFLEIGFDFPDDWTDNWQAVDASDHPQNDNNIFLRLPNLKTIIIRESQPPKFLADITHAAVNLRSFGGAWSACRQYFMGAEGGAKIHQLKNLQLAVHSRDDWNERALEEMEAILAEHKQNLKLETFECISKFAYGKASSAVRTVSVINQILECSSESLKKLIIEPTKSFDDLLIIPRLPQLQEVCFDCHLSSRVGFFPRGFNMNNSFPNVSTIILLRCGASLFRRFASRMEIELFEPVASIRYITLIDMGKKGDIDPPLATVTDFRHVFPNLVSISYVNDEKYYKV